MCYTSAMDESTLMQLLNSTGTDSGTATSLFDMDALMESLAPFMLAMTVISVLLVILYLVSIINKWRANKAILDIKKLLIEMNERDRLRYGVDVPQPAVAAPRSDTIAPLGEVPVPPVAE